MHWSRWSAGDSGREETGEVVRASRCDIYQGVVGSLDGKTETFCFIGIGHKFSLSIPWYRCEKIRLREFKHIGQHRKDSLTHCG